MLLFRWRHKFLLRFSKSVGLARRLLEKGTNERLLAAGSVIPIRGVD